MAKISNRISRIKNRNRMMKAAILTDLTKCAGCKACVYACKEQNDLPKDTPADILSATTWTIIEKTNGLNIRRHCMHCEEPACASACPVGPLAKTEAGVATTEADKV